MYRQHQRRSLDSVPTVVPETSFSATLELLSAMSVGASLTFVTGIVELLLEHQRAAVGCADADRVARLRLEVEDGVRPQRVPTMLNEPLSVSSRAGHEAEAAVSGRRGP